MTTVLRAAERGFAQMQAGRQDTGGADVASLEAIHAKMIETFKKGNTKTYEWRIKQLEGLKKFLVENKDDVAAAIFADLGRPRFEAVFGDVCVVVKDIRSAIDNLKTWMKPEAVSTELLQQPGRSMVIREPKGVVLAIAPWNFPVNLAIMSLIGAVSAGNCCVLKPSEISVNCERLLRDVMPRYVDPDAIAVVTGGVSETTALLKMRWDHIIYTGNSMVARVVATAAAQHLTPMTLELGGKSPTVVLPGAKLSQAVKRILNAKYTNCGQICIAPDYILVHRSIEADFVKEIQKTWKEWFGTDARTSPDWCRMVTEGHWKRVKSLIDSAEGEVLQHGTPDQANKFMPPTLIRNASPASSVMQEEIFGPVLPIMQVGSIDEVVNHINAGEKPLAMYIFAPDRDAQNIISRTSSGGVCVNDTLMQCMNAHLPFGGVGNSGMGRYHGKWGFDEFSHLRAVIYRGTLIDFPQRYPPYTEQNLALFERAMIGPLLPPRVVCALKVAAAAVTAAVVGLCA